MVIPKHKRKKILKDSVDFWLKNYTNKKYGSSYDIEIITDKCLSRDTRLIKSSKSHSNLIFSPSKTALMSKKNDQEIELILIMEVADSVSLNDISDMLIYCKIARPIEAFILSTHGITAPVEMMLLNKNRIEKCSDYAENLIKICIYDTKKNEIIREIISIGD
jgi:hypothetical protein|tara:strand:- start:704 stop:1192 length:489 start_codon:yes stop_codon:yes gene_type:complete